MSGRYEESIAWNFAGIKCEYTGKISCISQIENHHREVVIFLVKIEFLIKIYESCAEEGKITELYYIILKKLYYDIFIYKIICNNFIIYY